MQSCMLAGALLALMTSIPLAWKWQLGIRRTFWVIVALAALSDLVVAAIGNIFALNEWACAGLVWALTVAAALVFLAYRFYRDPERKAPAADRMLECCPFRRNTVIAMHSPSSPRRRSTAVTP